MYDRDEHNRLIVNHAWAIPSLPMAIIVELPNGTLKRFGVLMQDYFERHDMTFRARLPKDSDLHDYKGYHPKHYPAAHTYTPTDAAIYGLAISSASSAAAALGSIKSERKSKSSAQNGKKGGRPKKNK